MPLPDPLLTRRRAAIGLPLSASLAALTACRWGPEPDDEAGASTTSAPPRDADVDLVDQAVRAISETSAVVASSVAARPGLSTQLAGFSTLHEAHLRHLEAEPTTDGAPTHRPRKLAGVLTAERDLQDALVDLAGQAASGALARSLASMAAGIAQHLAVSGNTSAVGA